MAVANLSFPRATFGCRPAMSLMAVVSVNYGCSSRLTGPENCAKRSLQLARPPADLSNRPRQTLPAAPTSV